MMMRSTRPITANLPSETLGLPPLQQYLESLESEQWGRERSGVYHSFSRAQAGFLQFTIYSARIGLMAQANRNWSLNSCKHALTKVGLFTSMSPLPGVRGMLGASQFVNLVLFQFSGPDASLSAQPLLRSLSGDSSTVRFSSFCPRRPQADFYSAREKTYASPRSDGDGQPTNDPGGRGGRL